MLLLLLHLLLLHLLMLHLLLLLLLHLLLLLLLLLHLLLLLLLHLLLLPLLLLGGMGWVATGRMVRSLHQMKQKFTSVFRVMRVLSCVFMCARTFEKCDRE